MIVYAYVPRPRDGDPVRLRAFIDQFAPLSDLDDGVRAEVELARGVLADIEREAAEAAPTPASGVNGTAGR